MNNKHSIDHNNNNTFDSLEVSHMISNSFAPICISKRPNKIDFKNDKQLNFFHLRFGETKWKQRQNDELKNDSSVSIKSLIAHHAFVHSLVF